MNFRARWPTLANSNRVFTVQSRSPGVNCGELAMANSIRLGKIGQLGREAPDPSLGREGP